MRHKNITFSIPTDLRTILYAHISKRGMSKFISDAIRKAIEEEKLQNEKILDAAYEAANMDADRLEILQDWDTLDDLSDLVNEDEDWDWLREKDKNGK